MAFVLPTLLFILVGLSIFGIVPQRQPLSHLPNKHEVKRDLETGLLNFLHTTDTHGWVTGHINQADYSADFGDFYSFTSRLKENLEGDLILVDTGDRHDGQGLSDLTFPNGKYSNKVFKTIPYDLITVGNHELYVESISHFEYYDLVPYYKDRFVSTNVEFLDDEGNWRVFGHDRYRYFETEKKGYRILALSFLFDFKGGNPRVRVHSVSDIISSKWFDELMRRFQERVDVIVVFGHIPIAHEWEETWVLQKKIREYYPDTAIQFFGGHSHIRDFSVFDSNSTGLQSGRYCETVGFLSTNLTGNSDFFRSYIDFNLYSFQYHTGIKNIDQFNTDRGLAISDKIKEYNEKLGLSYSFGEVHEDYLLENSDYSIRAESSLLVLIEDKILPNLDQAYCFDDNESMNVVTSGSERSRVTIINTGAIRYDLYSGNFTRNSKFTISPFENKWKYIPNVDIQTVLKLVDYLNNGRYILEVEEQGMQKMLLNSYQREINKRISYGTGNSEQTILGNPQDKPTKHLSRGYVTEDDFGDEGDDTIHFKSPVYSIPNIIHSLEIKEGDNSTDLVFYDFIEGYITEGLKTVGGEDFVLQDSYMYNNCTKMYKLSDLLQYEIEKGNI